MNLISKLKSAAYYARRPSFWAYGVERGRRMINDPSHFERHAAAAEAWAAERAEDVEAALRRLNILAPQAPMPAPIAPAVLEEAEEARRKSGVKMGGPGDLLLLHAAVRAIRATRVVETGVAYGWSSLVILDALQATDGRLVSVDMPYIGARLESYVGLVVPARLRARWLLLREPDRNGIAKALRRFGGEIDLCHYDSDKSYPGRKYAYPLLWRALRPGGVFISDDIQDNFGFRDFAQRLGGDFAVTRSGNKFVGVIVKPA